MVRVSSIPAAAAAALGSIRSARAYPISTALRLPFPLSVANHQSGAQNLLSVVCHLPSACFHGPPHPNSIPTMQR